jgi:hypothetical protein
MRPITSRADDALAGLLIACRAAISACSSCPWL